MSVMMRAKLKPLVVMGNDPGVKNWGLAVVRFHIDQDNLVHDFAPVVVRQMDHTPTGKGDTLSTLGGFSAEQRSLIRQTCPSSVVVERYLPRGNGGALNAEQIGCGCGIVFEICRQQDIRFERLMPASWKNELNKRLKSLIKLHPRFVDDLTPPVSTRKTKPFKNEIERLIYPLNPKAIHVIDALLMTLYDVDRFSFIESRQGYARLVVVIQSLMVRSR